MTKKESVWQSHIMEGLQFGKRAIEMEIQKLIWKHGAVTFSPDGKYVVTAMQENALHGWRIRDKADLAMTGYPAKVTSYIRS